MSKPRNLVGNFIEVTAGAADTNFTVIHGLNVKGQSVTPLAFIVVGQNAAGNLYTGSDAWTALTASLKSSTAGVKYRVIFFA